MVWEGLLDAGTHLDRLDVRLFIPLSRSSLCVVWLLPKLMIFLSSPLPASSSLSSPTSPHHPISRLSTQRSTRQLSANRLSSTTRRSWRSRRPSLATIRLLVGRRNVDEEVEGCGVCFSRTTITVVWRWMVVMGGGKEKIGRRRCRPLGGVKGEKWEVKTEMCNIYYVFRLCALSFFSTRGKRTEESMSP